VNGELVDSHRPVCLHYSTSSTISTSAVGIGFAFQRPPRRLLDSHERILRIGEAREREKAVTGEAGHPFVARNLA
jgi:hypothetical protein